MVIKRTITVNDADPIRHLIKRARRPATRVIRGLFSLKLPNFIIEARVVELGYYSLCTLTFINDMNVERDYKSIIHALSNGYPNEYARRVDKFNELSHDLLGGPCAARQYPYKGYHTEVHKKFSDLLKSLSTYVEKIDEQITKDNSCWIPGLSQFTDTELIMNVDDPRDIE